MIRGQLKTALAGDQVKKCREFLNQTLRNLGAIGKRGLYKDIMDVFEAYAAKRAIWAVPGLTGAPKPASSPKARLEINLNEPEFVLTFFYELLHGSGRTRSYTHAELADPMYDAAKGLGIQLENVPEVPDQAKLNSKNELEEPDEIHRIDLDASKVGKRQ